MRLQLLSIGPWDPQGNLMGNLFFDTDEHPGTMAEYVAVRSVPEPPGDVFVDSSGELMTDPANPMVREADRIMRVLRHTVAAPGWELLPGYEDDDLSGWEPFLEEAARLMRVITLSAAEVSRRERAVRAVIHSGHLSDLPDDPDWQTAMWQYTRGEITRADLNAIAHDRTRSPAKPTDAAPPPSTPTSSE
jgi:hypothetical protein